MNLPLGLIFYNAYSGAGLINAEEQVKADCKYLCHLKKIIIYVSRLLKATIFFKEKVLEIGFIEENEN